MPINAQANGWSAVGLGNSSASEKRRPNEAAILEDLQQSCLYITIDRGQIVVPEQIITEDTARFYCVLAGELWMEILGHFPWEFVEIKKKVAAFEEELGIKSEGRDE